MAKTKKVVIKELNLQYSDYKNIEGELVDVENEVAIVALPLRSLFAEDERELRKVGDRVQVRVHVSRLIIKD